MKKCLQDVRETGENKSALFYFFNPNIGMTGSKSLEELLRSLIANLQLVETSFDLGSSSDIVINNLFIMENFGQLDLQIHIKGIKGERLRGFWAQK